MLAGGRLTGEPLDRRRALLRTKVLPKLEEPIRHAAPVGGEFVLRLESVCETDRDNAPPKHICEEQHARAVGMMRSRDESAWCR